jgi:hypothetical protein
MITTSVKLGTTATTKSRNEHFPVMSFDQLTFRDSLRDIESCLKVKNKKKYHSDILKPMTRNTLAKANEHRNWRIYAEFGHAMIAEASRSLQISPPNS